jgi:hypothetical protein
MRGIRTGLYFHYYNAPSLQDINDIENLAFDHLSLLKSNETLSQDCRISCKIDHLILTAHQIDVIVSHHNSEIGLKDTAVYHLT